MPYSMLELAELQPLLQDLTGPAIHSLVLKLKFADFTQTTAERSQGISFQPSTRNFSPKPGSAEAAVPSGFSALVFVSAIRRKSSSWICFSPTSTSGFISPSCAGESEGQDGIPGE